MKFRLADGCLDTGFVNQHQRLPDGFNRLHSGCPRIPASRTGIVLDLALRHFDRTGVSHAAQA